MLRKAGKQRLATEIADNPPAIEMARGSVGGRGVRARERILFVTDVDLSGPSGQNVATREVVGALAAQDQTELWVACPRSDDPSLKGLLSTIDRVLFLPPKRSRSVLWGLHSQAVLFRHLWAALRGHSFDAIVVRSGPSLVLPPLFARTFGVRYILLQRGMRYKDERTFQERILSIPLRQVSRLNVRAADRVFTADIEIKRGSDRVMAKNQQEATVLPNAVDPAKFPPLAHDEARSRLPELGLRKGDLVFGFVGSFQTRHGLDVLVRALPLVKAVHPSTKFLAVGDGPTREALGELAGKLKVRDSLLFTGMVAYGEISLYMATCDVLTAVVDRERPSNPIKVYEYLASERPVVVTDCPEFRFIEEQGLGRLVQVNDEQHFADSILALFGIPSAERANIGRMARRYIEQHHTWERFADTVLNA